MSSTFGVAPNGYRCILADPPWQYGDKLRMSDMARSAGDVYNTMLTRDICELADFEGPYLRLMGATPIANDAVLWLWVTNPFLLNGDGMKVCRAWGFEPKQLWTWVKGNVRDDIIVGALGMGHYMRVDTEHMILATRGNTAHLVQSHGLRNYTIVAPKGRHSVKPEEAYSIIENLTPGPRLELFARRSRTGWDSIGDQLPIDSHDTIDKVKI